MQRTVNTIIHETDSCADKYLIYPSPEKAISDEELVESSNFLWKMFDEALSEANGHIRSYKLWVSYTDKRSSYVSSLLLHNAEAVQGANRTFERALQQLYLCPRLWMNYLDFIGRQKRLRHLRQTFNRALQSLPILQHDRIWETYLQIICESGSVPTVADAYRRYIKIHPEAVEDAASWFINNISLESQPIEGHNKEASKEAVYYLKKILEDPNFNSTKQRTKYFYWMKLSEVIKANPYIEGAEKLLRSGCEYFVVETGRVWNTIADHYSRLGLFADALQVYEDALNETRTAEDFSIVFERATTFLNHVLTYSPELSDNFMSRLEKLLDRREILLNATLLRENANNIEEWIKKALLYHQANIDYFYKPKKHISLFRQISMLFTDDNANQFSILCEAIETVKPKFAFGGKVSDLWISLATLCNSMKDFFEIVFYNAEQKDVENFISQDDLLRLFIFFAETSIKEGKIEQAQEAIIRALDTVHSSRSLELSRAWSLALDIEWSFGNISSTRALFERCLASGYATTLHIIGYATFLSESGHKDDMFRVYERGISNIGYPNNAVLWLRYLSDFVDTYKSTKRERARDLFEEALKDGKTEYSKHIYILYAQFEEKYGLFNHAMKIYRRAAEELNSEEIYHVWLSAAMRLFGVSECRKVYEFAIAHTSGISAAEWCLKFSRMEVKIMETDRARDILLYGSQLFDPDKYPEFWTKFEEFENANGTKETFADMLSHKNQAKRKFNNIHIGVINTDKDEDEDKLLDELENNRLLSVQEQMIPKTIFDNGINANSASNALFASKKMKRNLN